MPETMSQTQRSLGERGFTLIELVFAVAIIGILAAIAFPSFMDSVRKSRRTDAVTALNNVQQAQERYRANKTAYADNLTAAPTADPAGLGLTTGTAAGYYTIALVSATATSYEATATAVSGSSQANDTNCATLEYAGTTSAGTLSYAATSPCWSR